METFINNVDSFSRNGGYSFLRKMLLVPKNTLLPNDLFNLLFYQVDFCFKLKKSKNEVEKFFEKNNLAEKNNEYRKLIFLGKKEEAEKNKKESYQKIRDFLNPKEKEVFPRNSSFNTNPIGLVFEKSFYC